MIITNENNKIEFIENYKVLKTLYLGSLSQVYLVEDKHNPNKQYVLKAIKNAYNQKRLTNEIENLKKVHTHKNITSLHRVFKDSNIYFFLFDYLNNGDLYQTVKRNGPLQEKEAICVLKDIVPALIHTHNLGIIHKDVKSDNIFIHNNQYFLGDWGLSEQKNIIETLHIKSDHDIVAPEVFYGQYSFESDIYSLGCMLYYLTTSHRPYDFKKESSFAYKMFAHCHLELNINLVPSEQLRYLISMMTQKDPKKRISLDSVLKIISNSSPFEPKEHTIYDRNEFLLEEPKRLYKKMSKKNNAFAQNNLALIYEFENNHHKAKLLYENAANLGLIKAMYNLALCYFRGKGTKKDGKLAYLWMEKAALKGHEKAQYFLAMFYEIGLHVDIDKSKAKELYMISAYNGCKKAHEKVKITFL